MTPSVRRPGSPRLDRPEWILLLDLYLRRRPGSVTARDPDLQALSALLSRRLQAPGAEVTGWRTPDGLRARMSVFRVLDPDVDTPDTKHADAAEAVWLQYWQDPIALRAAVEAARMQIQAESVRPGVRPSRGPVAWSGGGRFERPDGDCWVYVMVLDTVPGLSPPDLPGAPYIKVGRSNDVDRRAREFNAGLPPALGLAWRVVDAVLTASTAEADDLEQRLFGQLRDMGVTIGGEFVRADPAIVVGRLYDLA